MKLSYFLAEACQNTFVLFDSIKTPPEESLWKEVHALLLKTERDDALVLTLEKQTKDALFLKMHVLGADGKFGEFCGNGARSVASYLFRTYPSYKQFYLVTKKGVCPLFCVNQNIFGVRLPKVQFSPSKADGFVYGEILEPHLALKKDLSDQALLEEGKAQNQRKDLFPDGINVNAWTPLSSTMIAVKTYERGVQRLTRSCGTGSAVCASQHVKGQGKVVVKTPGGVLLVRIGKDDLELVGPAQCSHSPITYELSHD
jgi:diaminopimelate epimerase